MLPRHQLMPMLAPVSSFPSQTSQPFMTAIACFGAALFASAAGRSSTSLAFPASQAIGSRVDAVAIKSLNNGAGLREAAINFAACSGVGLLYSSSDRVINFTSAAASGPTRSPSCAAYKLTGRTEEFASRHTPLPSNSPQQPNA